MRSVAKLLIIGPGVTSSDDRVINPPQAHRFNIGAAAIPDRITSNLYIHATAQGLVVQAGQWTLLWRANGEIEVTGRKKVLRSHM